MREEETAGAGSGGAEAQQEGRARGQDGREAREGSAERSPGAYGPP